MASRKATKAPPKADGKAASRKEQKSPEQALASITDGLKAKIEQLEMEKKISEEAQNYMQLERDKINSFWETTKAEVREMHALLRQKDREAEDVEDKHQEEIKVYKQKIRHLLYEHQNNVEALKIDTQIAVKQAVDNCSTQQEGLTEARSELKQQLGNLRSEMNEALIRSRMEAATSVSGIQLQSSRSARDMATAYEGKVAAIRDEIEAKHKEEAQRFEDATNLHIKELVKDQNVAYASMKAYFNNVVTSSLDLIKALKADAAELKQKEAAAEALAHELALENKRLKDPLHLAQREVEELREKLRNLENAKAQLQSAQTRLSATRKQVNELQWKNEILEQRQEVLEGSFGSKHLPLLLQRAL